jgi:glycosyltransferase involved in cell wall biosynthesis
MSQFEELPKVTMQLPIFNEVYVVERLLKAVSEIDYPREKLQIQVLDDSTDDTKELTQRCVAELQGRGLNVELINRVDRSGFKAGALETGLATAEGEFVCILDADFVPQPDLLKKTVHFFTDPKVGMIQTRWGHLNRTYSLLTRVQAMFLDGHLLLEQTARSRSGRFFNFQWYRGPLAPLLHRGGRRLATRHADGGSRPQLPRAARRLEIHLPAGCHHAGRVTGRHERLQVAAASLDEGSIRPARSCCRRSGVAISRSR